MNVDECEKVLKKTILSCSDVLLVNYEKECISQILPHRDPFLLIDKISSMSLSEKMITAQSYISSDNPVFQGHFPKNPVYPGVLQLEMMGQAGLCLAYFVQNNCTSIQNSLPINGLFVKFIEQLLQPVLPQDTLYVLGKIIEHDDFLGVMACQIVKDNKICSYGILEVYFND